MSIGGAADRVPASDTGNIGNTASTIRRDEILETASHLFASRGLRTSLQDIADACGIKPGSLYHHFDSKEAIVVELIRRYHGELDQIAENALARLQGPQAPTAAEGIATLTTSIAECAARNSAAVQFTFYEPHAGATGELVELANRAPGAIQAAMLETLQLGTAEGYIRSGLDLPVIADRMCQTMLHVGLGLFHRYAPDRVAKVLCTMMLGGLAARFPNSAELDRSAALIAVKNVINQWQTEEEPAPGDRAAMIRAIARTEFGRRGYEVTTVRDIAAVAGLGTGSVYRVIGSKEDLLASIMRSFAEKTVAGWDAALNSDSTIVEKLDAVAWLQINVIDNFYDEFRIQLAWLRQVPPEIPRFGWSFPMLLRRLKTELAEGVRSGELLVDSPSAELTARCVVEMTWIPYNIITDGGKRTALTHARDTVLRGVAKRGG